MSSITMRSFADSTGSSAGKKKGDFAGKLLGKAAEGLEALKAMAALAAHEANLFMDLAMRAVKVHAQRLETKLTMPYANADMNFNPTLNIEKASQRRVLPSLGMGAGSRGKRKSGENT